VWIASHTSGRELDAEGEELAREVSKYAAVGRYAWKMAQDAAAAIAASTFRGSTTASSRCGRSASSWRRRSDAVQNVLPRIERRRQRLLVSAPPAPVELQADPVRIVQVLANLLDNAAKYTPDRGEIRLAATVSAGTAQLSVRDTGVGIPRDKRTAIFDPFAQIAPADGGARPLAGAGRTTGEAKRRDDSGVE